MIRLNPRRILAALLAVDVLLLAAYLLGEYAGWPIRLRALLDMNRDVSVPAWWSGSQLLLAGLLALAHGLLLRAREGASHWKIFVLGGLGLVFLSADEAAMIHETITAALYNGLRHRWDVLAKPQRWDAFTALLYGAAGLALLWPVRRDVWPALKERGTPAAIGGAALFVTGAVLVDNLPLGAGTAVMYGAEDLFELAGASLIAYAMLRTLQGTVVVHVGGSSVESSAPTAAAAAAPMLAA